MYKGSVAFGAGRGYRDGVRNVEVMVESLSGGSRPEIQEEGELWSWNKLQLTVVMKGVWVAHALNVSALLMVLGCGLLIVCVCVCVRSRVCDSNVAGRCCNARCTNVCADGPHRVVKASRCQTECLDRSEVCRQEDAAEARSGQEALMTKQLCWCCPRLWCCVTLFL